MVQMLEQAGFWMMSLLMYHLGESAIGKFGLILLN